MIDSVKSRNINFSAGDELVTFTPIQTGEGSGYIPVATLDEGTGVITVSSREYDFYCYPTYQNPNEVKLQAYVNNVPATITVDWGDNTSETVTQAVTNHTYATSGAWQVTVTIVFDNSAGEIGGGVQFLFNVEF